MTSSTPGAATLEVEVTNISALGFWLVADDREYFVPFAEYPDFKVATIAQIYRCERPSPDHLYWPELDIDIDIGALAQPERYPLRFER